MHKIVVKVGGSNLKDAESMGRVISLMKGYGEPVILVVSAFYGVTNRLEQAVAGNSAEVGLPAALFRLHRNALHQYVKEDDWLCTVEESLREITHRLEFLLASPQKEPAVVNEILSVGERLSARVVQAVLDANGVSCRLAFPEDIGMVSNRRFFQGSILLKKTARNLEQTLDEQTTYVVPGFYGISEQGETVLLGRGGSDYSAACLAHCTGASYLDV
jgi:aspartate kinase/aspartokinase/homoserine dehydrogenase 1